MPMLFQFSPLERPLLLAHVLINYSQVLCALKDHMTNPSFRLRDISVHLHECSPFWVGIFIIFCKENYKYYVYWM